ncbi:MAG: hypothetical protein IJT15_03850 [Rickettsiales bacterium]|nr:hypothetical protein [Rickettsiales bacterium]
MDNSKSQNIEICDFFPQNIKNIIDKGNTQLLCEYKVKYTHKGDNKEDKIEEIKIKIKIPISENCNKLDDFEVFVGIDDRALTWNATLSDNDKKEVLQYLMELKKELNQLNKEKQNKDFLNALCIMIFYYAVKENRYSRNNEWVQYMNEDDFKQCQEIIEKTIKEQETASKNDKNIVVTDNKISLKKTHPKDSDGRFCEFFNKCSCCCCCNGKTTATNNFEVILNTSLANNQGKITNIN